MKKLALAFLCSLLVFLGAVPRVSAASFIDDLEAIERASQSVLYLEIMDQSGEAVASGSGFIAFDSQTVVTNYHVVEDAYRIVAYDEQLNTYEIDRMMMMDKDRDIAILSLKEAVFLTPLRLAQNKSIKRGQRIATIGSPIGLINSFSEGTISAIYDHDQKKRIQFTAPISPGSSGGALFNEQGEVIGITSSTYKNAQNINMAIDISHVIDLYKQYYPDYSAAYPAPPTPAAPTVAPVSDTLQELKITRIDSTPKGIVLEWGPAGLAEKYHIYRARGTSNEYALIAVVSGQAYTDQSAKPLETYTYKVVGVTDNNGTPTAKSNAVSGKRPAPVSPSPKAAPTPTPVPTAVPKDESQYRTLSKGMQGEDVLRLNERLRELYYTKDEPTDTYTAKTVQCVKNFQRQSGLKADGIASPQLQVQLFSDRAQPKPTPAPSPTPRLGQPRDVKVSVSATTVTLTWKTVPDAQNYRVYRATNSKQYYYLLGQVNENKITDTNTARGNTYYYKIEAASGNNISIESAVVKAVMPKPGPTPVIEPAYPIVPGQYCDYGTRNNLYINPQIKNVSKTKTVDGFTVTLVFKNVYGELIKYGTAGNDSIEHVYARTIKPGQSIFPGEMRFERMDAVKNIYYAITRIHTTDGQVYDIPESEWEVCYVVID